MHLTNSRRLVLACLAGAPLMPLWAAAPGKPVFRIALSDTYAPYSFLEYGQLKGIVVEILQTVLAQQMGLTVQFEGYPWARAQLMVERDGLDALCTIATPARLQYTVNSTEPVLVNNFHLFVHRSNPLLPALRKVKTLAELKLLKPLVISYTGAGWATANMADFDLQMYGNFDNMMNKLLARRGDIVVDGEHNVKSWLTANTGKLAHTDVNDILMLPQVYASTEFDLLVSKTSPYLGILDEFNTRMKAFRKTPAYAAIFKAYGVHLEPARQR